MFCQFINSFCIYRRIPLIERSLKHLIDQAKNELNRMNRCVVCGDELDYYTFTEEYNELEYRDKKNVNEWYCPNCNIFY